MALSTHLVSPAQALDQRQQLRVAALLDLQLLLQLAHLADHHAVVDLELPDTRQQLPILGLQLPHLRAGLYGLILQCLHQAAIEGQRANQ